MKKLIVFSSILACIVIPANAAALSNPKVGFDKVVRRVIIFNLFYAIAVAYVYPHV